MKKNFNFAFAALAAFAMVLSCSKVEEPEITQNGGSDSLGQTTISATLSDALTKVAFTPSYDTDGKPSQLALAWEADDKLRVYDNADKTKYEDFSLDPACVGQKTGSFTGNLFSAESYYVEVINGDLEYAVQTQPADGVTTSLKYLASASAVTDLKAVEFTEYSSVLAITAKMPEGAAAGIASVELSASEAIFSTGKTLKIQLDQVGDAGEDGVLNLFATLPKGNQQIAEGTTLLVTFNAPDTDHTVYTRFVELGSQTFTAGKLNTININATQSDKHAGLISCDGSSAEKAYLIGDKYQMQAMGGLMTAGATTYFKMVADVDLAGVNWTPLNDGSPYDKGINFNGDAHTISNLTVGSEPAFPSFVGLLNGSVNDVVFDGAKIDAAESKCGVVAGALGAVNEGYVADCDKIIIKNSSVTADEMAAALGGLGNNIGTISDCHVINTSVTSTAARVGGIVGSIVAFNVISNCSVENSSIEGTYHVGGLFGTSGVSAEGKVTGCYSTGSVTATHTNYSQGGGLIGTINAGVTIENCYSTCSLTANGHTNGGLIANFAESGTSKIDKCYFAGKINIPAGNKSRAGGLVGDIDGTTTIEISNCYTSCEMKARRWGGGFIGMVRAGTNHKVTNCYTNSNVEFGYSATAGGVFVWQDNSLVTYTGNIALNTSSVLTGFIGSPVSTPTGNYMAAEGSISAKAEEFDWDETIWDLSGNEPVLKWTLVE